MESNKKVHDGDFFQFKSSPIKWNQTNWHMLEIFFNSNHFLSNRIKQAHDGDFFQFKSFPIK